MLNPSQPQHGNLIKTPVIPKNSISRFQGHPILGWSSKNLWMDMLNRLGIDILAMQSYELGGDPVRGGGAVSCRVCLFDDRSEPQICIPQPSLSPNRVLVVRVSS